MIAATRFAGDAGSFAVSIALVVLIETHSLPTLVRCYPCSFTLITRSPRRPRASYPSCVAVYPRDLKLVCFEVRPKRLVFVVVGWPVSQSLSPVSWQTLSVGPNLTVFVPVWTSHPTQKRRSGKVVNDRMRSHMRWLSQTRERSVKSPFPTGSHLRSKKRRARAGSKESPKNRCDEKMLGKAEPTVHAPKPDERITKMQIPSRQK